MSTKTTALNMVFYPWTRQMLLFHRTQYGSYQYSALMDGAGMYVNMRLAKTVIPFSGGERLPVSVLDLNFG